MFYHDRKLQYTVRVDNPNPAFARMLQQALGGVEGEIRVMMQYLFQAWNSRGPTKYRDMLLETGTEEIAHCEMLATAIAMNLEGAPSQLRDQMGNSNPLLGHIMSGGDPRQFLSGGYGALAADANGVPFNGSWIVSSGNIVSDMYSNVTAEATGRTLATRLWESTDDPGMKDLMAFLIARDTMHQQQWLAVIEEQGGFAALPVPNSFPEAQQKQEFAYSFVSTAIGDLATPEGRWTHGPSLDGKAEFSVIKATPHGQEPKLAPPRPEAHAQLEQMNGIHANNMTQDDMMVGSARTMNSSDANRSAFANTAFDNANSSGTDSGTTAFPATRSSDMDANQDHAEAEVLIIEGAPRGMGGSDTTQRSMTRDADLSSQNAITDDSDLAMPDDRLMVAETQPVVPKTKASRAKKS
jgi:Mn-containing catalase